MKTNHSNTLVNPQNGNLAFKVFAFDDNSMYDHLQRLNYYTMLLVTEGSGELKADFTAYRFEGHLLMCFAPYQPFLINATSVFKGFAVCFHPDFFCIHKHHHEVACNGVLFNNIYKPPFHSLESNTVNELLELTQKMLGEIPHANVAQYDLLLAYLKIFLITASRSKILNLPEVSEEIKKQKQPFVLQQLQDAIEIHFRTKHAAGEYAALVNLSPKALAKITKQHFNKTLTELVSERLMIEAKRELYLTGKPVKTIAWELGFEDEYYFSRFFKNKADVSPQLYRDTVGFARATA